VTIDIAERYGILINQLTRQGAPMPSNDIWIAASALETGSRLVTYDAHFKHIHGLIVISP
jgi:tRNA(fMet)-specific endonuclease VapC